MIITERHYDNKPVVDTKNNTPILETTEEERDENGMTRDEVFDQLEDDSRIVTSGRGSRLAPGGTTTETNSTGYSAGVGSGTPE